VTTVFSAKPEWHVILLHLSACRLLSVRQRGTLDNPDILGMIPCALNNSGGGAVSCSSRQAGSSPLLVLPIPASAQHCSAPQWVQMSCSDAGHESSVDMNCSSGGGGCGLQALDIQAYQSILNASRPSLFSGSSLVSRVAGRLRVSRCNVVLLDRASGNVDASRDSRHPMSSWHSSTLHAPSRADGSIDASGRLSYEVSIDGGLRSRHVRCQIKLPVLFSIG
jgi:hypothetical protein